MNSITVTTKLILAINKGLYCRIRNNGIYNFLLEVRLDTVLADWNTNIKE